MTCYGLSCFLFVLPHFLISPYSVSGGVDFDETCTGAISSYSPNCESNAELTYISIFFISITVMAVASSTSFCLGITFIHDNSEPDLVPKYVGIFIGSMAFGPAIGFVLGGIFLNHFVNPSISTDMTPMSSAWVGQWWPGFFILGFLLCFFSSFFYIFPRNLNGTIRQKKQQQHKLELQTTSTIIDASLKGVVFSLLSNKSFLCVSFAGAFGSYVTVGFGNFLPKVLESQFSLTASSASLYAGALLVLGVLTGIVIGSIISKKWSNLQIIRKSTFLIMLSTIFGLAFMVHCEPLSLAGVNANYPAVNASDFIPYITNNTQTSLTASCNSNCNCKSSVMAPVCIEGITYFNPCYGGCSQRVHLTDATTAYSNCSCAQQSGVDARASNSNFTATGGICSSSCPGKFALFFFLLFLFLVLMFMTTVPLTNFTLAILPERHRTFGMGCASFVNTMVGAFPGPLVVGALFDRDCVLWEETCGANRGACWLYDSNRLSSDLLVLLFVAKGIVITLLFGAWKWYTLPEKEEEEDEGQPDSMQDESAF